MAFNNKINNKPEIGSDEIYSFKILFESSPGLYLILLPDFTIYAVSDEYLKATMTTRESIIGKNLFEVFPDNPDDISADGTANLRSSLNTVLKTKEAHRMSAQKYDIRKPDGVFEVRYWSPLNKPVLNDKKEVVFLIHSVEDITLRINHEKEIAERIKDVSDYKFALDEAGIVAFTDKKGIIKYVNEKFCQISKYSREELIGQDHRIVNSGYHSKEFMRNLWATISSGKVWKGEIKNLAKDGTPYWVDTRIVPFLDDDGKPYQYVAVRLDITKQKELEYQLKSQAEELIVQQEELEEVNTELQAQTKNLLASEEELRVQQEELISANHEHREKRQLLEEKNFELVATSGQHYSGLKYLQLISNDANGLDLFNNQSNEPKRIEFKFKKKNGQDFYGEAIITQTLIDGETHIQVSVSDITEKKEAEEKIIASEARLHVAQKMAKIGDWRFDIVSGELIWSSEMYNIYNCDPDEFSPNVYSLVSLIHHDDKPVLKKWIEDLYIGKKNPALVFRVINPDKSIKYILGDSEIIFDDIGKPIIAVGTAQDITHLREVQEKLKKTIDDLNNRCNELTQFNYIVSHNLRAPVATIMGLSGLINQENISKEEQQKIMDYIRTTITNMDEHIKHLNLVLSTRSGLNEKKELVSFSSIIKSISDTFENEINTSGAIIEIQIQDTVKEIYTIKSYLESIFCNLISNAIKFRASHRKQNITIHIQDTGTEFLITVSDTGIGIDLNLHSENIFGLYKRFNFETEGKGLGLHMVKTQIETLGGKIEIQSQPNQGTTFTITLPK